MWPSMSHTLAPLTRLTSIKWVFKWTQVKKYAFNEIRRIVARDTFLSYPYFNETFKIHTNASTFQLGAVISQKGRPISFYSRKLTDSKKWYTVIEIELLSIVETLKGFIMVIPGQKLIIHTDHKDHTCEFLNKYRFLRWQLILE